MRKVIKRLLLWIIVCTFLFSANSAAAHAGLVDSEPSAGATLNSPPEVIRLTFSEPVLEGSTFTLMTTDFHEIEAVSPSIDPGHPEQVYASLPSLEPGIYTVQWHAVSEDGGETDGSYSFEVRSPNEFSPWFVGIIAAIGILVILGLGLLVRRLQAGL
jgi:methionine-rich copper-binding protein CopC